MIKYGNVYINEKILLLKYFFYNFNNIIDNNVNIIFDVKLIII